MTTFRMEAGPKPLPEFVFGPCERVQTIVDQGDVS
jgi:hypothetical protein